MRSLAFLATSGALLVLGTQGSPAYRVEPLPSANAPTVVAGIGATDVRDEVAVPSEELTSVVQRYCVVCHNDQLLTGNLSLQDFDVADPVARAETAEKMIGKLRLGMMPPPGMPRPSPDTLQLLISTLENEMDRAAAAQPYPGVRRFQRMAVAEYERTVSNLLGLEVDATQWLPSESYLGQFDTWSDRQGLSGVVIEAYLTAAGEVSRMVVGNPSAPSTSTEYQVPIEVSQHAWNHVDGAPYGTRGGTVVTHNFPADGKYVFSVQTSLGAGHTSEDLDISVDGERVGLLALRHGRSLGRRQAGRGGDAIPFETEPVFVQAGQSQVAAAFIRRNDGSYQDLLQSHDWSFAGGERTTSWADYGVTNLPHLSMLTITGPFEASGVTDTPSRQKVFSCYPSSSGEERPCAESIIERIATEAYRRPVTAEDMGGLMTLYEDARAERGFDIGIRTVLQAILSSPAFIFRLEEQPSGLRERDTYALSDMDLASRLSFFLWGTVPDQELLTLAREGELSRPDVLEAQIHRMLADARSEALATRFAAQWLRLDALDGKQPVPAYYPNFSLDLARSMRRETELFFDHLVRKDRSFLELFTADYTFVNERLARFYEIPYTGGSEFQMVQHTKPYRVVVLGHGSVLALTSLPDRTSPVMRGVWFMEVLLGSPPPPPPPNVPALEATSGETSGRLLTTRERMEIHRARPTCNSCHQFIDPIGLALDHFDPTGRMRMRENRTLLDTRGKFYDGTPISNSPELVNVLLKRPVPLVQNFAESLLSYAIGRPADYRDQPTIRTISRKAAENDYRMSSFILGVVQSDPFRMRQVAQLANTEQE